MKNFVLIFILSISFLYSNELILPLVKEYQGHKKCYLFSSLSGEIISLFECEDIAKQTKDLIAVKKNNKWGFVDKFGNTIIPYEYDFADNFYSNLARVRINDKYGFIDKQNKIRIQIKYRYAGNFSEIVELAPFQCDNHNFNYGYLNKKGETVIPCQYQIAYEFRNTIAKARKWDLYGYLKYDIKNNLLKEFINFKYELAGDFGSTLTYVFDEQGFLFLNKSGQLIKPFDDNWILGNFSISNTKSLGVFQDLRTGLYGYLDENQHIVIPPIFIRAYEFFDDYAKVKGPIFYQNKNISIEDALMAYKSQKYEDFYIDIEGRRITFLD